MEEPTRQRADQIDFYDKPPERNVHINKVNDHIPRVICEYREITGLPNPGYRRLFYHDHPNETPQLVRTELQELTEELFKLNVSQQHFKDEFHQNEDSFDDYRKRVNVAVRFAQMVQGSSPLFAVQDVVMKLLIACDGMARREIQNHNLQERFKPPDPEANRLPAAYRWLVEESKNGDTSVQNCLTAVHSKVKVMSVKPIDAERMLASLRSYTEARKQRDLKGHPCSLSPKGKVEDIMKFIKEIAEGDGLLPEPYTNDDREFVMKAVEHWSMTPDQEAGASGEATPTEVKRSKTTEKKRHQ